MQILFDGELLLKETERLEMVAIAVEKKKKQKDSVLAGVNGYAH